MLWRPGVRCDGDRESCSAWLQTTGCYCLQHHAATQDWLPCQSSVSRQPFYRARVQSPQCLPRAQTAQSDRAAQPEWAAQHLRVTEHLSAQYPNLIHVLPTLLFQSHHHPYHLEIQRWTTLHVLIALHQRRHNRLLVTNQLRSPWFCLGLLNVSGIIFITWAGIVLQNVFCNF